MKTKIFLRLVLLIALYGCSPAPITPEMPTTTVEITLPSQIPVSESPATTVCYPVFNPVGFLADGDRLIGLMTIDGQTGTYLQSLDLKSLTVQTILKSDQFPVAPILSPNRQQLAWALPDFRAQIIDLQRGDVVSTLSGHTDMLNALVFSPDGSKLYSGSSDGSVIIWDKSGDMVDSFQPTGADDLPADLLGLGISPDGKTLITIPFDGNAKAWDTLSHQKVGEYQGAILGSYNGAKAIFSPDGQFMVIGLAGGPGTASMWRVSDSTKLWTGGFFADFDFSPDNRYFAHGQPTEDYQAEIVISSPDAQTIFQTLKIQGLPLGSLFFSPDSTKLVVPVATGIDLWNVSDGTLLKSYKPNCP